MGAPTAHLHQLLHESVRVMATLSRRLFFIHPRAVVFRAAAAIRPAVNHDYAFVVRREWREIE